MLRTRTGLLAATAGCIERGGVRPLTMNAVAAAAGVAKGTLYNHFRTKDELLQALVATQVAELAGQCRDVAAADGLVEALVHAAQALADSGPLRRVAADEPGVLAAVLVPGAGPAWDALREGVTSVLSAAGLPPAEGATELVVRWLLSQAPWPASEPAARAAATALERGLR